MRHRLYVYREAQTQIHQGLEDFVKQGTTKEDRPIATEAEIPGILALKQGQENHHMEVHFKGLQERKEEANLMITLKAQVKLHLLAQLFVLECQ
jgi:hypothetical protein